MDEVEYKVNSKIINLKINDIMKYLPHRYPFLLIDSVTEIIPKTKITALKNVTINEQFFVGHFENNPIMPGVLIIEALAQASGILSMFSIGEHKTNELLLFIGINNARFKRQVLPGDQLILEATLTKFVRNIGTFETVAKVNNQIAAKAEIMLAKREI